jgi:hypothetical protein
MGFIYQAPTVVGGTVLVIERIESQNYVTNVSGWVINADGTAEFFNVVVRGSLVTGVAPGQRIEINGTEYPNEIAFFSGNENETEPGRLLSQVASALQAATVLNSPTLDGGTSRISLTADAAALGGDSRAQIDADEILLNTFGAGAAVEVRNTEIELNRPVQNADLSHASNVFPSSLATLTGVQTLTNKNLSSSTNTFPSIPYSVAYSGTTDANGFLTVTHGAPFTPVGGWAVTTNPSSSFALFWGIDTIGATTVRLRFANAGGDGPLVSLAAIGRLFLVRP